VKEGDGVDEVEAGVRPRIPPTSAGLLYPQLLVQCSGLSFESLLALRFSSPAPPNLLPCPCLVEGEKGLSRRMRRPDTSPQTWYSRLLLSARIASSATSYNELRENGLPIAKLTTLRAKSGPERPTVQWERCDEEPVASNINLPRRM